MTPLDDIEVWIESHGRDSDSIEQASASAMREGFAFRVVGPPGDAFESVPHGNPHDFRIVVYLRDGYLFPGARTDIILAFERFADLALLVGDSEYGAGQTVERPPLSGVWMRSNDYLGPVVAFRRRFFDVAAWLNTPPAARALVLGLDALDRGLTTVTIPVRLGVERPGIVLADTDPQSLADVVTAATGAGLARVETFETTLRRVRIVPTTAPLATIILRATGARGVVAVHERVFAVECLRSMLTATSYPHTEYLVLPTNEVPESQLADLRILLGEHGRVLERSEAADINLALACARGSYIAVIGERMELVTPGWLEAMIGLAEQRGVGAVGGMVFAEIGSILHAGFLHEFGALDSVGRGLSWGQQDPLHLLQIDREVSGISGDCLLARREVLEAIGGYAGGLRTAPAGFDISMKLRGLSLSTVLTPSSRWYGFPAAPEPEFERGDLDFIHSRWLSHMQSELQSRALVPHRY